MKEKEEIKLSEASKVSLDLKAVVGAVIGIVSIAGVWFTLTAEIAQLQLDVVRMQDAVKLNEEFSETIESPIHEDFCYASFSEGEKMRIDLALLFTWREVAAYKNSTNTNLLIMDEVFDSSLDGTGTDEFLKIIKFVIKDANIFVISHKESLLEKFESVIQFEKLKGFSKMLS